MAGSSRVNVHAWSGCGPHPFFFFLFFQKCATWHRSIAHFFFLFAKEHCVVVGLGHDDDPCFQNGGEKKQGPMYPSCSQTEPLASSARIRDDRSEWACMYDHDVNPKRLLVDFAKLREADPHAHAHIQHY